MSCCKLGPKPLGVGADLLQHLPNISPSLSKQISTMTTVYLEQDRLQSKAHSCMAQGALAVGTLFPVAASTPGARKPFAHRCTPTLPLGNVCTWQAIHPFKKGYFCKDPSLSKNAGNAEACLLR